MTEDTNTLLRKRTISLIKRLELETSEARKIRSYLRRSPIDLAQAPDAWQFIYRGSGENDLLSGREYQAIYTAVRFYALHSVSNRSAYKPKSEGGKSIAEVLAAYRKTKSGQNIDPKVSAILSSSDTLKMTRLLETLFSRAVKTTNVPLDYGEFSQQLKYLQYPDGLRKVTLSWGKNYYQNTYETTENKETK